MAYVDYSSYWVYKKLIDHQAMDGMGEDLKIANDLLTAVTDISAILKFDNAKGISGEVAAGGSYKKIAVLDASNVVQLGEAGTEVRVPQDPVNALGVATKAYVDGVQMFQTQPKVVASGGASDVYATVLSLAATTRARVRYIGWQNGMSATARSSLRITIDGGTPVVITTTFTAGSKWRVLQSNLLFNETEYLTEDLVDMPLNIACNTSLLIEAKNNQGGTPAISIVYEKIP